MSQLQMLLFLLRAAALHLLQQSPVVVPLIVLPVGVRAGVGTDVGAEVGFGLPGIEPGQDGDAVAEILHKIEQVSTLASKKLSFASKYKKNQRATSPPAMGSALEVCMQRFALSPTNKSESTGQAEAP